MYLNNFYINNIVSTPLLNNKLYNFPNSQQLYITKENDYYYIYYIYKNKKYYLYLNIDEKKNYNEQNNIDIVFRSKPDIYNMSDIEWNDNKIKWKFILKKDYIENILTTIKDTYNIRSKIYNNTDVVQTGKKRSERPDIGNIGSLLANDNRLFIQ